jgi:hypothetical protein
MGKGFGRRPHAIGNSVTDNGSGDGSIQIENFDIHARGAGDGRDESVFDGTRERSKTHTRTGCGFWNASLQLQ